MSGRDNRKDENGGGGGGGGGWVSTFWKVASAAAATAVVAGGLYSVLKQPEAEQVEVGAGGGTSGSAVQTKEGADAAAVWTKPTAGWVKLNVDGSLLPESAGCGGVLRNASGKWLYGFAQKLNPSSKVDEIEKEGILKGLQWAKGKGVRKLVVESDNEGIVYMVNSDRRSTDPLICDIRELLHDTDLWEVKLISIRREANRVADKLANIARRLTTFDLQEFDSPPEICTSLL